MRLGRDAMERQIAVVTLGEAMVRLATPPGVALENAYALHVNAAGSESNVAIGLARLGVPARWVSLLADDPLGRLIANSIRAHGVDVAAVWRPAEAARVGVYFIELGSPPRPTQVLYHRSHSAFSVARPDDMDWSVLGGARYLHLSGVAVAVNPQLCQAAIEEARRLGLALSFDVNYRVKLWDARTARAALQVVAYGAEVLFCTSDDAERVFGIAGDAQRKAEVLQELLRSVWTVVTDGPRGAVCLFQNRVLSVSGHELVALDRVGAGDAFAAGFLAGLIEGEGLAEDEFRRTERALQYGSACAALKHTYYGDLAWFTREDVLRLIAGGSSDLHR